MSVENISLMAHLMRRAGFGATRTEIEAAVSNGYEATVEQLLQPADPGNMPDDIIKRLNGGFEEGPGGAASYWTYRMITSSNPLEEKLTLFWHGLFATAYSKGVNAKSQLNQIETFRRHSLGAFPEMLFELSRDPAMIFWLDNNENHNNAINENYGRELLELFAMGIDSVGAGSYTEEDVKECARAFTGWTMANEPYMRTKANKDSFSPFGRIAWHFEYRADDHDDGEKTFLGETGRFNGEDIIDIIVRHPATATFICTRLFQFFVADEVDKEGAKVIEELKESYFDSKYSIRSVMKTLFNTSYFKSDKARFACVKSPVELVVGAVRMAGSCLNPTPAMSAHIDSASFMGQGLLRPPGVEGWHEGQEWIESGSLVERVNFAAKELGDVNQPGIQEIINRLAESNGKTLTPEELVDRCLDLLGPIVVSDGTRTSLTGYATKRGQLDLSSHQKGDESEKRVGEVLSLIASTPEYQLA